MLINLLTQSSPSGDQNPGGDWIIYVILIGFLALMIVPSIIRQRKDKKAQEEKLSAIEVGAKVTTIGLIHGEIVDVGEVYVVIKTGTEENPSFLTVEKRAIYQVHKAEEENANASEDMPEDLPEEITDEQAFFLSKDIAKRIEDEMEYPGQIKVNVIREQRFTSIAK